MQRHSLEALINIVRHPVSGPTVHTLDISVAHITGAADVWGSHWRYYPEEGHDAQTDEEPSSEDLGSLPSSPRSEDSRVTDGASSPERALINTDAYNRYRNH